MTRARFVRPFFCRLPVARSTALAVSALIAWAAVAIVPSSVLGGWMIQTSGTEADLHAVTASHGDDNFAWACGDGGLILHTTNGGATWTAQNSGTTENLYDIVFWELTGGPVVAVGANGTILYTEDGGATWTPRVSGTTATLRSITDFGTFIVGDGGTLLYSEDSVTWAPLESPTDARLNACAGAFSTVVVGARGTILREWNLEFTPVESPTTEDLNGTPMFGTDIAVGDNGTVVQKPNGAPEWILRASGTAARLNAIEHASINASVFYAVGEGGMILKTTDGGVSWGSQASETTAELRGVFFYLSEYFGYAVGTGGTILRTTDGGGPIVPTSVEPAASAAHGPALVCVPNPFEGETHLVLRAPGDGPVLLEIFDPAGRRVGSWRPEIRSGETRVRFRPEGAANGVYLGRMTTRSWVETVKIVRVQ